MLANGWQSSQTQIRFVAKYSAYFAKGALGMRVQWPEKDNYMYNNTTRVETSFSRNSEPNNKCEELRQLPRIFNP